MRIWITGICGNTGSKLAQACLDAGHLVDGNDTMVCGNEKKLPKGLSYVLTDCRNYEVMRANFHHFKPDVLVHTASHKHDVLDAAVNTFLAAQAEGIKNMIHISGMDNDSLIFTAQLAAEKSFIRICDLYKIKHFIYIPGDSFDVEPVMSHI